MDGNISGSRDAEGKEGRVQWEQFLDLLTAAEVMLFIFGRLLMSEEAGLRGRAAPGDLTCTPKCPAWKKPARCPWTGGAHSLSFTLQSLLWDCTHSSSICLLSSSPPSPLSFHSIHFFSNLIFSPLSLSSSRRHIHHLDSHIHLLSPQHILACCCFSLCFGRPVFTNGLLPADRCFRLSCINYCRSRMELNEIQTARISCFLTC